MYPLYRHSGLGLLTPHDVRHGLAEKRVAARTRVLATAYAAHPERFSAGLAHSPARPVEVWINRPKTRAEIFGQGRFESSGRSDGLTSVTVAGNT